MKMSGGGGVPYGLIALVMLTITVGLYAVASGTPWYPDPDPPSPSSHTHNHDL